MAIPQQVIVAAAAVAGAVLASQTACVAELADKLVSVVASLWARDETSAVLGAVFFFGLMFFVGGNPFARAIPVVDVAFKTAEAAKKEISKEQPVKDPKRPNHIQCWNPSTGEFLGEVPVTKPKDVPAVIASARAAQQQWISTSFEERKLVLKMIKAVCMEQRDIISKLSSQDTGKTREF